MMKKSRGYCRTAIVVSLISIVGATSTYADQNGATGIISSIEKAPVIADGNVAGQPFDYVFTLDGSLDPQVLGRGIAAGGTIKVFFPEQFDLSNLDPAFPLLDVPNPGQPCVPGMLVCSTAVILRGWEQDPFFLPSAFFTLSIDESENAFVYTANKDIGLVPGADRAPYIKQLHLILHGLKLPHPGAYRFRVEAETGPDGSIERGEGLLTVLAKPKPSINVTSVFVDPLAAGSCGGQNPPNPNNPRYQVTEVRHPAPFVWTFLLWGKNKEPLDNVRLRRFGRNLWLMIRSDSHRYRFRDVIGYIHIDTPPGAGGQNVQLNNAVQNIDCPTLLPAAPVIGATPGIGPQPVGRLDLQFTAGNKAGVYRTRLALFHGNSVEMIVTAE